MKLTREQVALLAEALDSHVYWQLSPEDRRDSGYVLEPYTEEEQAAIDLQDALETFLRNFPTGTFELVRTEA